MDPLSFAREPMVDRQDREAGAATPRGSIGWGPAPRPRTRTITITPVKDAQGAVSGWDHHCSRCGATWRDDTMRTDCPPGYCRLARSVEATR